MVWVVVAVVVVLLVVGGLLFVRQQRSHQLKEGFGPEYDRVVTERGDQRAGERELLERRRRREELQIRPLDPSARERYLQRWGEAQRRFVDEPTLAVEEANGLVTQVMSERGYPVDDDFEQRAADISVDHPVVVENYRAAHGIARRAGNGQASTEDLRQSIVHFRALFDDLLAPPESTGAGRDPGETISETTRSR